MFTPTTVDALLDGALLLEQPAPGHGYRVNVDALHLARFAAGLKPHAHRIVDLGAGVGTIALAYAHLATAGALAMVERDELCCELARRNAERNGAADCCTVLHGDVASVAAADVGGTADLIVINPPYTTARRGRAGPVPRRDGARRGELGPFVEAAARLLAGDDAIACICYPGHALVDLLSEVERVGMHPHALQMVHGHADGPARIVLLAFATRSEPLRVLPFVVDPDPG